MKKVIILIVLLLILGGTLVWKIYFNKLNNPVIKPVACTMEAKLCPDGSSVGRSGPNCEFATCPVTTPTQTNPGWETFTDATQGISFQYPPTLTAKYISTQEWPPKVSLGVAGSIACVSYSDHTNLPPNLVATTRTINNRHYCVESMNEGAAGSTYTTYNYSTDENILDGKAVAIHFILRYPQCGNYPDPKMTECSNERSAFDLDNLIDQIAQSIRTN